MSNSNDPVKLFSELLGGPLGELISSIGKGVGDAQAALDEGALRQTLELYDTSMDAQRTGEELKLLNLIRGMGYQPTFYTIPETEVEAQISLSLDLRSEQASPIGGNSLSKYAINATPLNAGNVNRFGLQASAMAKLKFKVVPVPPPTSVSEIRIIPNLINQVWNTETKELIQNLGFTFELINSQEETISEQTAEGLSIQSQNQNPGAIASINTTLRLKLM
jgi:hypothetical protein